MITDIETYFTKGCGRCARFATPDCSTRFWIDGLVELRRICRDVGLAETLKWAHPCYMQADRNIALIGAFRDDFRLTFFNAALMTDPENILVRPGPNTAQPNMIRFTEPGSVVRMETTIRAYLHEAMGYAAAGLKAKPKAAEIEIPEELGAALDQDPDLAEAFHSLTRGRQRSYVIALGSAKKPETRVARIEKFRSRILAGKGATER